MTSNLDVQQLVEEIHNDLASVKWTDTTPTTAKIFVDVDAKTFSGSGNGWTHNLIVWNENGVDRCDGSAVAIRAPLIVRYTPDLAILAYAKAKEGAKSG